MKKKVSFILVVSMLVAAFAFQITASAASTKNFTDVVDGAWYTSAINYAVDNSLFNGTTSTTFEPNGKMTRGMFVTVLGRFEGADVSSAKTANFSDVKSSDYFAQSVNWAYANGYVSGMGNNTFEPNTAITREQIAVILTNYFTKKNVTIDEDTTAPTSFKDNAKISSWAKESVEYVRKTGLMTGDENGNFAPQQELTRAEAATVFMRVAEKVKGEKVDTNTNTNTNTNTSGGGSNGGSTTTTTTPTTTTTTTQVISGEGNSTNTTPVDISDITKVIPTGSGYQPQLSDNGLEASGAQGVNSEWDADLKPTVEAERYIKIDDTHTAVARTLYYAGDNYLQGYFRKTLITFEAKIGETFTFDCRDWGITPKADDFGWFYAGQGGKLKGKMDLKDNKDGTCTVKITNTSYEISDLGDFFVIEYGGDNTSDEIQYQIVVK
jgi:hypothetical protein